MFDDLDPMWEFLFSAPYYIVGAFLLTFIVTKLIQSEVLYQWALTSIQNRRARRAHKIHEQMADEIDKLLRGRQENELSPAQQHLYHRTIEYHHRRLSELYGPSRIPNQSLSTIQEER